MSIWWWFSFQCMNKLNNRWFFASQKTRIAKFKFLLSWLYHSVPKWIFPSIRSHRIGCWVSICLPNKYSYSSWCECIIGFPLEFKVGPAWRLWCFDIKSWYFTNATIISIYDIKRRGLNIFSDFDRFLPNLHAIKTRKLLFSFCFCKIKYKHSEFRSIDTFNKWHILIL